MSDRFDNILDTCVDRINRGERIEDCLADYPEYAPELEPLLRSMLLAKNVYSFEPRPSARQEAKQRFTAATSTVDVEQRHRFRCQRQQWSE